ncbi:MAG: BlaI/MecI/CopY family transcriptional regulator [Bacteroidota bacterium]
MTRRTLNPLGETEMEVLQHVWDLGSASVGDVHARILASREVAYTTVMTVMKKLAKKGYLAFERDGNAYIYSAAQPPEAVRRDLLQGLMDKAFHGSPGALVQTLVGDESLSADELDAIRRIVDAIHRDDA